MDPVMVPVEKSPVMPLWMVPAVFALLLAGAVAVALGVPAWLAVTLFFIVVFAGMMMSDAVQRAKLPSDANCCAEAAMEHARRAASHTITGAAVRHFEPDFYIIAVYDNR